MDNFHNGYVEGSGKSSFAARADHTHEGMAKATKVTVKTTDWDTKAAEVEYSGTYVGMVVDAASADVATTAVVVVTSASEGTLTLGCTTDHTATIDIWVLTV